MQTPTTQSQLAIAPLLLRVLAVFIDGAILIVIGFALIAITDPDALGEAESANRASFVIGIVTGAIYHITFLVTMSATPGKLAMGLYVSDRQGARIRPDTAILRYIIFLLGNAFLIGLFISIGLVLFDPQRRAIHDRVAGTLVLRRPQDGALPPPDLT